MFLFAVFCVLWLPLSNGQLTYVNSGVFKFIVGYSVPVNIESPGHGLGWLVNLQGLYRLPDNITYFQPYKILQKRSVPIQFDRPMIYKAIEKTLNRKGFEGVECICRIICEMASVRTASRTGHLSADDNSTSFRPFEKSGREASSGDEEHSLLTTLLRILFTPNKRSQKSYLKAYYDGLNDSSNCINSYNCSVTTDQLPLLFLSGENLGVNYFKD